MNGDAITRSILFGALVVFRRRLAFDRRQEMISRARRNVLGGQGLTRHASSFGSLRSARRVRRAAILLARPQGFEALVDAKHVAEIESGKSAASSEGKTTFLDFGYSPRTDCCCARRIGASA